MDSQVFPPSSPAADEQIASDRAAFGTCDEALQAFISHGGGTVTDRRYSVSPEWGNVLRAKVALGGGATPAILVFWSKPGEHVEMVVDVQGPGQSASW